MKTQNLNKGLIGIATLLLLSAGACSSMQQGKGSEKIAATGPSIINARATPGTVELNRNLQPTQPAEVTADVKDFTGNIKAVKLQFTHVPIEVPMRNIGGTTWRAQLTSEQLRMLAVSGKTMRYDANVIAQNDNGQTAVSPEPVEVAVKAPDLSTQAG